MILFWNGYFQPKTLPEILKHKSLFSFVYEEYTILILGNFGYKLLHVRSGNTTQLSEIKSFFGTWNVKMNGLWINKLFCRRQDESVLYIRMFLGFKMLKLLWNLIISLIVYSYNDSSWKSQLQIELNGHQF